MEAHRKVRPQVEDETVLKPRTLSQPVQLSLFGHNDMSFFNQGVQAFNNLELDKAVDLLKKHRSLYPKGCDVSSRLKAAEFLLKGLNQGPAADGGRTGYLCRLWDFFEEHVKSEGIDCDIAKIKGPYFSRVLREVERAGPAGSPLIPGFVLHSGPECRIHHPPFTASSDIPLGWLLLQAGRYDEAIRSLQECIAKTPQSAALYGWLGDAYLLRGDPRAARQCYREACFIDPAAIDWLHIEDADLKQLRQDILLYYNFDPELALEWLPSHARIEGLFERKEARIHDGLKELVDDYLALERAFLKEKSPRLAAKLFLRGIVLCENGERLKFIRKFDPIHARKMMKQANPDLFEEFLERIVGHGHA